MTKRIVSGIFILTALGALGVILAGALTSGEQLIVRFLTAVIVAALGLYVISDLRLQADDDAMTARSNNHPRLASVDAPPNSTAAFMATVTKRSEHKTGEIDVTSGPSGPGSDEQADQHMVGAGATTSSATESMSAAVEDAESIAGAAQGDERAPARPKAPDTVRAEDISPSTDLSLTELFAANGSTSQRSTGPEVEPVSYDLGSANGAMASEPRPERAIAMPSVFDVPDPAGREAPAAASPPTDLSAFPEPEVAAMVDSSAGQSFGTDSPHNSDLADKGSVNKDSADKVESPEEPVAIESPDETATSESIDETAKIESIDDAAVIDALAADYVGPLRQAELAVAAMTGAGPGDSEINGARNPHSPVNGSPVNGSPVNGSPVNGSPFTAPPANGRRPNGTPRRLLDSIEGLSDISGLGRSLNHKPVNGSDADPGADPAETVADNTDEVAVEAQPTSGNGPESPSGPTAEFEYSDDLQSPVGDWPAPPVQPVEIAPQPHPFEKASAAYQAEKERLAAAATDLPVVSPKHGLEAADYADAPLAPIIDLRHVNSQNPTSVDAAINAGEVEVIATLIEQGMLSTDGPISDRDVRTMVYVAFTSNELRKLLLAGGTPDGPNFGLDLGPVELFDERVHAPAPKTLYSGIPQRQPQSQIG